MEIDFVPVDYEIFNFENRDYARLIGRSFKGKRICVIDKVSVYFWAILEDNLSDKKISELSKKIEVMSFKDNGKTLKVIKVEIVNKKFLGKDVTALKIFVANSSDAVKIAERINFPEIKSVKESSLNSVTRYILDKKVIPMKSYRVSGNFISADDFGGISSVLDVDLCVKADKIESLKFEKDFSPKVLAFDIETDDFEVGKGKILMISLVGDNFKKVLTWKKISQKVDNVEYFESEKDMLEGFVKHFKKFNPDILTGYFSDNFDLPYLKSRAEENKVKLKIGVDGSGIKFTGGMSPRGKISGVVHVDLLKFIDTAYSQYLQSETLGLNDVSSELLGEKKKDFEFKHSSKMSSDEWKNFFEYNLQDSVLTYKLFMKSWPDMYEFCRVMQEPLFSVSRDGMSANVEHYIIHNLDKYNEIIENKPEHDEISKRRGRERYEGAFVLQPVPKLYENIVMFDFTSYWPSIIASFNLSLSTYLGDKKPKNIKENDIIEIEIGKGKKAYFSKKKGFFPEMLEEIIKLRKQFKNELKKNSSPILKARSNAFKLLANASYGYQGFFGARYYCPEASAATTAVSRDFIKKVIEISEKNNFKAIYSDTDSVCLELKKQTKKQALDFLKKINDSLPGIMELELEDFYERGIWVTTRKGDFGAKKKYALINEQGKMKIRGFETVRRDWCNLARELQNKVLFKILKEGNEKSALEYTKELIKKVKERKIDKKSLIIRTQLKKTLSEYKAVTPHVTIARRLIKEGYPVDQGMLIEYFIGESADKKALTRERAMLPEDDKPYDINYYLEKQILPAVENIFMVFNVNTDELIKGRKQKTLGDF
ncbi:MAG TPA: DNA-directed DNA polymerase [Candidatus Paceibacterota bacterium]|nr:DNA-directed DNA polymerase [Candidatus Paceibacterota bacterium]